MARILPPLAGLAVAAGLLGAMPAVAATHTAQEAANKKVVLDFYAALNQADATHTTAKRARAIIEKYISPQYVQHAAAAQKDGAGTPRDKLIRMFESMPDQPGTPVMPKTLSVMAEGDRVTLVTSRDTGGGGTIYIFNLFRVKAGKLIEHWDSSAPASAGPPPGAPGAPGARP